MPFLLRVLLVAVASLCLIGTRLVMQRHLRTETARRTPVNAVVGIRSFPDEATEYSASSNARRYVSSASAGVGITPLRLGAHSPPAGNRPVFQPLCTSWRVGLSPAGSQQPTSANAVFVYFSEEF